jgi:hypothetical protein
LNRRVDDPPVAFIPPSNDHSSTYLIALSLLSVGLYQARIPCKHIVTLIGGSPHAANKVPQRLTADYPECYLHGVVSCFVELR